MMPGLTLPRGGGFLEKGQNFQQGAINAFGAQRPSQKTEIEPPGKTAGGALASGAGYGLAGYQVGSMIGGATSAGLAAGSASAAAGAAGGAAAGAGSGATAGSSAGPVGAIIGAGIGILAYLLS